IVIRFHGDGRFAGQGGGVTGLQGLTVDCYLSPGDLDLVGPSVCHGLGYCHLGLEPAVVYRRILVDGKGFAAFAGGDGVEPVPQGRVVDDPVFIPGIGATDVGHNPNLEQMNGVRLGAIHLTVANPTASGHTLYDAGPEFTAIAKTIFVDQASIEHPGDDFHIPVRMEAEPGAGGDDVFVDDTKGSE